MSNLAKYIVRTCFSRQRMVYIPAEKSPDGSAKVVYTSKDGKIEQTFAAPSSADLEKLRNLTGIGAYTEILEELSVLRGQGPEAEPFADHLLGLLKRFQFDAILKYLKQTGKTEPFAKDADSRRIKLSQK